MILLKVHYTRISYVSVLILEMWNCALGSLHKSCTCLVRMHSVLGSATHLLPKAERDGGGTMNDPGIFMRCAILNATRTCVQLCT